MPQNIMLDSGFWYALYNSRDNHHQDAFTIAELLIPHTLVIPWPSLYETLNTRFVRRGDWVNRFSNYIFRDGTILLEDEPYRENALELTLRNPKPGRSSSLVDAIIRLMLEDVNVRVDTLITFNEDDFWDVCSSRDIAILSG